MKANRKVMLGAALVVAIVALAGVGYAVATGYTATTQTASNSVNSSEYIIIRAGESAYTGSAASTYVFDTVTTYDSEDTLTSYTGYMLEFTGIYKLVDGAKTDPGALKYISNGEISTSSTNAEYTAIAVRSVAVTVDLSNAGGKSADLTANITGIPATNTNTVKVYLSYEVGGSETIFSLTDGAFTVPTLTATSTVTFNVYIAVPCGAIEYNPLNAPTSNATLTTQMTFVAESVSS